MLDVPVIITRRRTSRLSMRIGKDGSVRVSAPWLTSRRAIEEFVSSHEDWIEQALVRTAAKRSASEAFYSGLDISTPATLSSSTGDMLPPNVKKRRYAATFSGSPERIF